MRILDECLLGKKKGGVVTDGLILWLDSLQTRNGSAPISSKWEDLSGNNYDFTSNGGKVVYSDNSYRFSSGGRMSCSNIPNGSTYEITFATTSSSTPQSIFCHPNVLNFLYNGSAFGIGSVSNLPSAIVQENLSVPHIVSIIPNGSSTSFYMNGVKLENGGNLRYNSNGGSRINLGTISCYYMSNLNFIGKMYSFKVYNRQLTEAEILQNYKYEQSLGRVE